MTPLTDKIARYVAYVLGGGLLIAVLFLCWDHSRLTKQVADLKDQTSGLKADAAAATTHDAGTKVVYVQQEKAHAAVDKAIAANPEWASAIIPDDAAAVLLQSPSSSTQ